MIKLPFADYLAYVKQHQEENSPLPIDEYIKEQLAQEAEAKAFKGRREYE